MLRIRTKIFTSICRADDYDEENDDIFFIYNKFKQYASAMNNVIAGESTADSKAMLAYSLLCWLIAEVLRSRQLHVWGPYTSTCL